MVINLRKKILPVRSLTGWMNVLVKQDAKFKKPMLKNVCPLEPRTKSELSNNKLFVKII